jgi:hypothetical protein
MADLPAIPPSEPISDSDRVAAIARLHDLVGSGDLSVEKFSASLDQVLAAESQTDLESAMVGLPSIVRLTPSSRKSALPVCVDAAISRLDLGAGWQLAADTTVKTNTGRVQLDLCNATWDAREVDLHLQSVTGKIDVIIPKGVSVQIVSMTGRVIFDDLAPPLPGGPVLRIDATTKAGRIRFTNEIPSARARRWRRRKLS